MTKAKYSTSISRAITDFLTEDDWNYTFDAEKGRFQFILSTNKKLKNISYIISVREDSYIVYATSPIGPSADNPEEMARMAEFICRANFGLVNGNFELDFRDGEIRYKTYVNCDGIVPTEEIIRSSIFVIASMYKRYADGITDVLFKDITPEEAIKNCEQETASAISDALHKLLQASPEGPLAEKLQHLLEFASDTEDEDDDNGLIELIPEDDDDYSAEDKIIVDDYEADEKQDEEDEDNDNEEKDDGEETVIHTESEEEEDDDDDNGDEIVDETLLDLSDFLKNLKDDSTD